jgi:cytochrome P450
VHNRVLSHNELGLRVYAAAPSLLERVVPATSSKNGSTESFDILGYGLPPGTVVATQAWSMHRDPSVFPSPDAFLPDRWLVAGKRSQEELGKMSQYMGPFGMGSRTCGGQNLAQIMLRVVVAAIVRNFDIVAASETNERSMDMTDCFVSWFCIFLSFHLLRDVSPSPPRASLPSVSIAFQTFVCGSDWSDCYSLI